MMFPSDQVNFKKVIGICALKKSFIGMYVARIHTPFDTKCREENVEYVACAIKEYIEKIILSLSEFGVKQIVLTSVVLEEGKIGSACYDGEKIEYYFKDKIDGYFHGSGDVYSSSLLAALLKGKSLIDSVKVATDYTCACIKRTKLANTPVRYGVNFEEEIPTLIELLKK